MGTTYRRLPGRSDPNRSSLGVGARYGDCLLNRFHKRQIISPAVHIISLPEVWAAGEQEPYKHQEVLGSIVSFLTWFLNSNSVSMGIIGEEHWFLSKFYRRKRS